VWEIKKGASTIDTGSEQSVKSSTYTFKYDFSTSNKKITPKKYTVSISVKDHATGADVKKDADVEIIQNQPPELTITSPTQGASFSTAAAKKIDFKFTIEDPDKHYPITLSVDVSCIKGASPGMEPSIPSIKAYYSHPGKLNIEDVIEPDDCTITVLKCEDSLGTECTKLPAAPIKFSVT